MFSSDALLNSVDNVILYWVVVGCLVSCYGLVPG